MLQPFAADASKAREFSTHFDPKLSVALRPGAFFGTILTRMTFDPDHTPYQKIGGEAPVLALVKSFYDHMDSDAEFSTIRNLHPEDLARSRENLSDFLSGWLGGPDLFVQKHGHPRLRQRHAPFSIGETERDQWLACMAKAMDDNGVDGELRSFLETRFAHVADFMRNR